MSHPITGAPYGDPDQPPGAAALLWTDARGQPWRIELGAREIVFRSSEAEVRLPRRAWPRDLSIAPHDGGFIVRVETFDREIGFMLSSERAAPLLRHLLAARDDGGVSDGGLLELEREEEVENAPKARATPRSTPERFGDEPRILWPRVSPLAVWALICSALVFLPVFGLIPALATVVLLVLHRRRTRAVLAMAHSRIMCRVAAGFLVCGLVVSALATYGVSVNGRPALDEELYQPDPTPTDSESEGGGPIDPTPNGPQQGQAGDASEHPTPAGGGEPPTPRLAGTHRRAEGERAQQGERVGLFQDRSRWPLVIIGLFVILASLSVHEAAHAITALWHGDDFPRRTGRVTLNPLAHIDPIGTVVVPAVLALMQAPIFGWARPVQVITEHMRHPRVGNVLVSLAGPGSNLIMAAGSLMLLLGMGCVVSLVFPHARVSEFAFAGFSTAVQAEGFPGAAVFAMTATVLRLSFIINLGLAIFNLLPIPPLDGSWVCQGLFPNTVGRLMVAIRPYGFILLLVLLYSNALEYVLVVPLVRVLRPALLLLGLATGFT
jgi:Zn-dependent protease